MVWCGVVFGGGKRFWRGEKGGEVGRGETRDFLNGREMGDMR
jgi:hypothetical protein